MNISQHLKKQFWKRRIVGDVPPKEPTNAEYYEYPVNDLRDINFRYLTQEDFAREIEPSAHEINSRYQSTRPIKEAVPKIDAEGKPVLDNFGKPVMEWRITGYDSIETTRFGYQKRFSIVKASHMAADGFWIAQEGTDASEESHKLFDSLNSWKDTAALDTMYMEVVSSCFDTGDAGVYLWVTNDGDIDYKVYRYDDYTIFPDLDENRNPEYYVLYNLRGKLAVDYFSVNEVSTWVSGIADAEKIDRTWWRRVKNWFKSDHREVSEDGWVKVNSRVSQVPKGMGQFFYFRVPDIPSGIAQADIEAAERSASFVAEGVKSATFDTLFVKATSVESLPPIGSHGSVLAVKGDTESLKASDAKRLAPSDISNVATIDLKTKTDSILHSTCSVIVEPDILRSGADSSSAMRLCFVSEIQWCQTMWPWFARPLRQLMNCFKHLVAKVEEKPEIAKLRISVGQNIWIPANRGEQVEQGTKLLYAGALSAEALTHELDLQYPNDMEQIKKEAEEKIYRETYIRLKAEAQARKDFGMEETANDVVVDKETNQAEKDAKPKVDNNADRKDVAE